jgi:hypothetical protein
MVNQMSKLLSVITIFILTTLIAQPSYSDDITINLDSTTPYVDIPVTVSEPVDATISTTTGTPQTNPGFIDSWIEVWQDTVRLAYNDDGAHSASNVLASIINIPLQVGEYFIRATSYAYICCNAYPTGSYLLSTNLVVVSPTPTPSSSPTIDEPTPEPSSPSPSPSDTPSPSESPEVPVVPVQEPSVPDPVVLLESSTPEPSPLPSVQDTLEAVVDSSPSDFPSSLPSLPESLFEEEISSTNETESFLEFLPEFSLENLQETFQEISESITAALSTVSNLGSEFTPEEREQAQQVVLGAIIVTQLSAAATTRRIK